MSLWLCRKKIIVDLENEQESEETLLQRKKKLKQKHDVVAVGGQSWEAFGFGSGPVLGVKFGVSGPPPLSHKGKGKSIESEGKDYAKVMAELPADSGRKCFEGVGYIDVMKEAKVAWSELAGAYYLASNGLKLVDEARTALDAMSAKDQKIVTLERELAKMKLDVGGFEDTLKDSEDKARSVEVRVADVRRELSEAKKELTSWEPTDDVISEFKKSKEYRDELGKKSAANIGRSWVLAEK